MNRYTINFTAEELKVLSQALMLMEHVAVQKDQRELLDEHYVATFFKTSDALNRYYDTEGIK